MITVTVTPDGGDPYTVTATARDILTWEKTSKGNKTFVGFMADMNMTDLYEIARIASWRQGHFTGTKKEFEESCDVSFAEEEQEEEPDPSLPGPSPAGSSDSQSELESRPATGQ